MPENIEASASPTYQNTMPYPSYLDAKGSGGWIVTLRNGLKTLLDNTRRLKLDADALATVVSGHTGSIGTLSSTLSTHADALTVHEARLDVLEGTDPLPPVGTEGQVLTVVSGEWVAADSTGGGTLPVREDQSGWSGMYPPTLTDNEEVLTEWNTFSSLMIIHLSTPFPMRVRVYGKSSLALADQSRPTGSWAPIGSGCFLDVVTTTGNLDVPLGPLVPCANQDDTRAGKLYVLIQNLSGETNTGGPTFRVLQLEDT